MDERKKSGEIMAESNPSQKLSLDRAKTILREQWPEVIQFLNDRSAQAINSTQATLHSALSKSSSSP